MTRREWIETVIFCSLIVWPPFIAEQKFGINFWYAALVTVIVVVPLARKPLRLRGVPEISPPTRILLGLLFVMLVGPPLAGSLGHPVVAAWIVAACGASILPLIGYMLFWEYRNHPVRLVLRKRKADQSPDK